LRHIVNLFKAGTLPFCLALCKYYQNFSHTALTYTACHGSYGLLWLLKDCYWFPDKRWTEKVPLPAAGCCVSLLGLYWLAPLLIISRKMECSPQRLAGCVFTYIMGVLTMTVADCHKHYALKYYFNKSEDKGKVNSPPPLLLSDGIFYSNRNPNYLGEMLLYGSFAAMCKDSKIPWVVLAVVWTLMFGGNMIQKDEISLKRKPGWPEYRDRSWLFLFKPNFLINALKNKKK